MSSAAVDDDNIIMKNRDDEQVEEDEEAYSYDEDEDDSSSSSSSSNSDSDSDSDSFDLSCVQIQNEDSAEVKNLKMKLLKEKSRVLDTKETVSSLVEQITAYKASVEEEKLILESSLKQEKKTKLELFEIYKETELEKDNLAKQLEIVILECEQLEKEKQTISKENINNLQTLMNEITHIEESNSLLEKELEKERQLHQQTQLTLNEQILLSQKLESFNNEFQQTQLSSSSQPIQAGAGDQQLLIIQLKKQLSDTQSQLNQEKERLQNLDNLLFQGRKIIGFAEKNGGQLDQNAMFEINSLKGSITDEKGNHHKTLMLLEEERKKSELNKKTADNLVARMKELISSHHETLSLLDDEKENSKLMHQELQALKESLTNKQQSVANNSASATNVGNNNNNQHGSSTSEVSSPIVQATNSISTPSSPEYEEGKLRPDPSVESISSQGSDISATTTTTTTTTKRDQKMYKTIRMKKNGGMKLGGDLMINFGTDNSKPTSPETSDLLPEGNSINTTPVTVQTHPTFTHITNGGSNTVSGSFNRSTSSQDIIINGTSTTPSKSKLGANFYMAPDQTSGIESLPSVPGYLTNSPKTLERKNTNTKSLSKIDKENKEREKRLEKEKKEISRKNEKYLKKLEKLEKAELEKKQEQEKKLKEQQQLKEKEKDKKGITNSGSTTSLNGGTPTKDANAKLLIESNNNSNSSSGPNSLSNSAESTPNFKENEQQPIQPPSSSPPSQSNLIDNNSVSSTSSSLSSSNSTNSTRSPSLSSMRDKEKRKSLFFK